MGDAAEVYSKQMMNAKLCPVPRGTSLESYRFFEALRFGCIPIVEALPARRYYDEAPVIHVTNWSELDRLVPALLDHAQKLREKHEAALHWWRTKCSEKVVGEFMAQRINQLTKEQ
jgi:hypothetical protein